jgi:hypothetical protein
MLLDEPGAIVAIHKAGGQREGERVDEGDRQSEEEEVGGGGAYSLFLMMSWRKHILFPSPCTR